MKTYKVRWAVEYINDEQIEHPSVSLEADSPKQAYAEFLDSETTVRNVEVIVEWGMFGGHSFSDHIGDERVKKIEEVLKAQEEEEERKRFVLELTERMKSEGFDSLNGMEIQQISEVVDHSFSNPHAQSNEETNLVKAAVGDSAFYRYMTLRNTSLSAQQQAALLETLGAKLSDISSKAGGIRAGTAFAGLAAAKHLGEEMAEDFGGDE